MSLKTLSFEAAEESISTLDEIAENLGENRDYVLRQAVAFYLADYQQLQTEVGDAERQIDAGDFFTQEQMEARFETKIRRTEAA